ncbi:MAG: hypothetical protein JW855_00040 [Gammaproteobacteria bacterium]|nr:hypothetical protein [Gammaproteobacteria bacterium]
MTEHTFHIPVLGTGFSIDTPLKVAKYGISSVISLVDDVLIEQMRKFYCEKEGEPYEPIGYQEEKARARRITAYLDLLNRLVQKQVQALKNTLFEYGSEITKYFEMLPPSKLKTQYLHMLKEKNPFKKKAKQEALREVIKPGSIDVNIMTKVDRDRYHHGERLPNEYSDASMALEGFAKSSLASSVVLSAGFNPRLYNYFTQFADFFPDEQGEVKKKIILKVSDYRSAEVQGKYFAKHGLWVSEYRVESPINCGGHAFVNGGELLGPILEQFRQRKDELIQKLRDLYDKSIKTVKSYLPDRIRITAQGGIGTHEEHEFLLKYYQLDAAGWATPFMMVPEVINIDKAHIQKLINASESDVYLSDSSPLNVPFWNLRTSASEMARQERITKGKPGSICLKQAGKLFNTEFTQEPICTASCQYQQLKLKQLQKAALTPELLQIERAKVLNKSCICHDLAGNATLTLGIDAKATPAVCCGPNILNFKKIATLKEMVNHIYGLGTTLLTNKERPHMFIKELMLNIDYLKKEIKKSSVSLSDHVSQKFDEIKENLLKGIEYYRELAKEFIADQQQKFLESLERLQLELEGIPSSSAITSI